MSSGCLFGSRARNGHKPVELKIRDQIGRSTHLEALDRGTLHVRPPGLLACPAFHEDKDAPVVERLVQLVAQAAWLPDGFGDKDLLRLLTCGSVDDGKSTLIGGLLHDTRRIFDDQLRALEQNSKTFGTTGEAIDFALLLDGLEAEDHDRCRLRP